MYYVSEKNQGNRELVCHLKDICHVEVGNGWPPGHFTMKLYFSGEDQNLDNDSLSLDSFPSKVFSASTHEEIQEWITVLCKGLEIDVAGELENLKRNMLYRKVRILTADDQVADSPVVLLKSDDPKRKGLKTASSHIHAGAIDTGSLTDEPQEMGNQVDKESISYFVANTATAEAANEPWQEDNISENSGDCGAFAAPARDRHMSAPVATQPNESDLDIFVQPTFRSSGSWKSQFYVF
jgi:hypothetical protein